MKPALGSSPLGMPTTGDHALSLLTGGVGRRMRRLLSYLATTTHGYSDATLIAKFGTHVESLLTALFVANHIERDLGNRWRLTVSGRNLARRAA